MYDTTPLNVPPLRTWDLNENSTRYDHIVAAPSDEALVRMWAIWSALTFLVSVFVLVVFLGILSDTKARRSSFNLYLIFLMVPDLVFSLICTISCAINSLVGHFYSESLCRFQSFYVMFGIGANAWLNAVVAHELFKMLQASNQRLRYFPPTRRYVTLQAVAVYLWSAFVAALSVLDIPNLPLRTSLQMGAACVPVDYDAPSSIFFFCLFLPIFALIPLAYVIYSAAIILRRDLLPVSGKSRDLAVYFFRLMAVFILMWLPSLVFLFVARGWVNPWVQWVAGSWSHLQAAVSAAVSLMKTDIARAVHNFVFCKVKSSPDDNQSSFWSIRTGSLSRRNSQNSESRGVEILEEISEMVSERDVETAAIVDETMGAGDRSADNASPAVKPDDGDSE